MLRFVKIDAGARHTCALAADGVAYCWGYDGDWALGPSRFVPRSRPTAVNTGLRFVDIAAGSQHTCGLTAQGTLHCWGISSWGGGYVLPTEIAGPTAHLDVTSTFGHVCSRTQDAHVACFGLAWAGQLGPSVAPTEIVSSTAVVVPGLTEVEHVTTGKSHTCAIAAEGAVWCWGSGDAGQLGIGEGAGTCQLGPDGEDAPCALEPFRIAGAESYIDIAAGLFHTCGLLSSGEAECWGDDAADQLGVDEGATSECTWVVEGLGILRDCELVPRPASGSTIFASLDAGSLHTCGTTSDGDAFCWGSNSFGQIGSGASHAGRGPEPVAGGHKWAALTGGQVHTCGLTVSGVAYCWGDGQWGQLGSYFEIASSPVLVQGG